MNDNSNRLHALDSVRGFALLLGVAFHAIMSFIPGMPPGIWAMVDNSPSPFLADVGFVTHIFRMSLFFFIAGFFARMLYMKRGARGFFANRALRIGVPLLVGWPIMISLIGVIWTLGVSKVFNGAPPPMPQMPEIPGAFPLTHLWFLYQLLMLYVLVIGARAVVVRFDQAGHLRALVDRCVSAMLKMKFAPFVLGLPLAAALMSLPFWIYWTGIPTPDMSLIPQPPATIGYGTAFIVGWLMHRSKDALTLLASRWFAHLVFAVIATGWLLHVVHTVPMAMPDTTKTLFAMVFGVAVWGWVLGLTGLALRFLPNYSATRRYLADASYWVYLAHLPVVAALQVWVGHWNLHWSIKFPFVLATSLAFLFLSYHFLVRSTVIGQLLNGRKYPRGPVATPPDHSGPGAPPPGVGLDQNGDVVVASLRGVTKRYGAVTALSNIDLEVRSGELLAVLGPNGAGKTTAIGLCLGLMEADGGEVTLMGGSPLDVRSRRGLGVMMQDVDLYRELRVRELIELSASYYHDPMTVAETLRATGTEALADKFYGKLSGGQKRQVQFAIAICGRPRVLFLDEPTVGLDIQAREALWDNIRALLARGCSIVLTTHYLEEAEALASRVVVLAKGSVIATGSVDEVRARISRRQIACQTDLPVDQVLTWPGVMSAKRDATRLHITALDAEGVVRRLLASDSALRRLEVREAGLAEVFTELTREAA